jgi:hypothetical protein
MIEVEQSEFRRQKCFKVKRIHSGREKAGERFALALFHTLENV